MGDGDVEAIAAQVLEQEKFLSDPIDVQVDESTIAADSMFFVNHRGPFDQVGEVTEERLEITTLGPTTDGGLTDGGHVARALETHEEQRSLGRLAVETHRDELDRSRRCGELRPLPPRSRLDRRIEDGQCPPQSELSNRRMSRDDDTASVPDPAEQIAGEYVFILGGFDPRRRTATEVPHPGRSLAEELETWPLGETVLEEVPGPDDLLRCQGGAIVVAAVTLVVGDHGVVVGLERLLRAREPRDERRDGQVIDEMGGIGEEEGEVCFETLRDVTGGKPLGKPAQFGSAADTGAEGSQEVLATLLVEREFASGQDPDPLHS
ncbi:MAG: hypothetical protein QW478_12460, partial [Candidatus Micrarchaeaceae archaeon]